MEKIVTGEDLCPQAWQEYRARYPERHSELPRLEDLPKAAWPLCPPYFMARRAAASALPTDTADGITALSVINDNRWIVRCPCVDPSTGNQCAAAQHAMESDRRYFCHHCLNAEAGGKWIRVEWPDDETRREIERTLLVRPRNNRNWEPGETVEQLMQANRDHGLGGDA